MIFVVDVVSAVTVPLVKLGTTVLAMTGVQMTPVAKSRAGVICLI